MLFRSHEKGVFGEPAVRVLEDRIIGPGVIDCKGGIAIGFLCMKALLENGCKKHVRMILTSDEEISNILGGEEEIRFIQDSAKGFPCAINCETAERDEVVIARKAILKYRLDIQGVGGHSGRLVDHQKMSILPDDGKRPVAGSDFFLHLPLVAGFYGQHVAGMQDIDGSGVLSVYQNSGWRSGQAGDGAGGELQMRL